MSSALLLDTHCWVWAQLGLLEQMSRPGIEAVKEAEERGALRISVISVWELNMLEKRGRVSLPTSIRLWIAEALQQPGVALAPLTPEIAIESVQLPGELHPDPADRILVATARITGATLLTKDRRLLDYARAGYLRAISA